MQFTRVLKAQHHRPLAVYSFFLSLPSFQNINSRLSQKSDTLSENIIVKPNTLVCVGRRKYHTWPFLLGKTQTAFSEEEKKSSKELPNPSESMP